MGSSSFRASLSRPTSSSGRAIDDAAMSATDFPSLTASQIAARMRAGSHVAHGDIVRACFARARGVGAGRDG